MIKLKIKERDHVLQFLLKIQEMDTVLDEGKLKDLYNVVCATINPNFTLTDNGYAVTESQQLATKILSLASDWPAFIVSRERTPKQIVSTMTLHRITGSKEITMMLHKMNRAISYRDVLDRNKAWAKEVQLNRKLVPLSLVRNLPTHVANDNNDGSQETVTGKGTTHDTNRTIFQPALKGM